VSLNLTFLYLSYTKSFAWRILTIAGHDTTANTLAWVFYELSRHPEAQAKIRAEIKALKAVNGRKELDASDIELLPYTTAVIKW